MDIHGLEVCLSQEQIFKELASNSFFFIPSTRLHGSPESPPWVCNAKYWRFCSGFFPRKQITKLSTWEDQQIEGKSHLLIQTSTWPFFVSFFYSSFHNPLRFSVQLALWRYPHVDCSRLRPINILGQKEVVLTTGIESKVTITLLSLTFTEYWTFYADFFIHNSLDVMTRFGVLTATLSMRACTY